MNMACGPIVPLWQRMAPTSGSELKRRATRGRASVPRGGKAVTRAGDEFAPASLDRQFICQADPCMFFRSEFVVG